MLPNLTKSGNDAKRAITLFEMMIVLTLTLILSLIFVYSSKFIIVRTKVERVKEEHRALSRALQNYRMDYNDYPMQLSRLNAPTAYISSLPGDPFTKQSNIKHYAYYHQPSGEYEYFIISVGPDGDSDLDILIQKYMLLASSSDENNDGTGDYSREEALDYVLPIYLINKTYDPTNGIISDGDVITFSHK
ncbi:type II secretion system protein GspG [Candidatus Sumerlaeota bacterium]|nr:type II secretion system protein GspG [Candidatus Sumerlaeota bacterium]